MPNKKPTLEEMLSAAKVGEVISIDPENLTRDELHRIFAPNAQQRLLDLLISGHDRDLVIEGHGILEDLVTQTLQAFLIDDETSRGVVRTSAAKIDSAFCLGLVSRAERHQFKLVNSIRNQFAHDHKLMMFGHDEKVVSYCQQLPPVPDELTLSARFMFAVMDLYHALRERPAEAGRERRSERLDPPASPEGTTAP